MTVPVNAILALIAKVQQYEEFHSCDTVAWSCFKAELDAIPDQWKWQAEGWQMAQTDRGNPTH